MFIFMGRLPQLPAGEMGAPMQLRGPGWGVYRQLARSPLTDLYTVLYGVAGLMGEQPYFNVIFHCDKEGTTEVCHYGFFFPLSLSTHLRPCFFLLTMLCKILYGFY